MAIRRPSIDSPTWLFQDFLYLAAELLGGPELRYLQVKQDGKVFEQVSETYDYSNPPFVGAEQRGGPIVAQIDYTLQGLVVTINDWSVNWRDEWPLRLASNYLIQCLYPPEKGFLIRVAGGEVYNQAGEAIEIADKDPYAFWVSEQYFPLSNRQDDYLVRYVGE